jgi:hypothetical protein
MSDGPAEDPVRAARSAFQVLGRAEASAMAGEVAARAAGATEADVEAFTAETLGEANCAEYLDALRLLSWRARELRRALEFINIGGPRGTDDAMMYPIVVTGGALADLVTAAFVIRDSTSENVARDEAAASWSGAIKELSRLTGNEPIELAVAPKRGE